MQERRKRTKEQSHKEMLVQLMEDYGDMVIRIAYTYVKEKQQAEDLSQEIFIKCYQSLGSFEHRSSYQTWLYRITVNCCKDYVKSWSFRSLIPRSVLKDDQEIELNSVASNIVKREENEILYKKVLNLSVKLREVVLFYYYEDLSVDEIAHILSISPNTVKSRLHRARQKLKSLLKGEMSFER